ncbi:MAG TPA: hypothetical protein VFF09_04720 [archaeon]|nr:hypothetical protein [archaeon]
MGFPGRRQRQRKRDRTPSTPPTPAEWKVASLPILVDSILADRAPSVGAQPIADRRRRIGKMTDRHRPSLSKNPRQRKADKVTPKPAKGNLYGFLDSFLADETVGGKIADRRKRTGTIADRRGSHKTRKSG